MSERGCVTNIDTLEAMLEERNSRLRAAYIPGTNENTDAEEIRRMMVERYNVQPKKLIGNN